MPNVVIGCPVEDALAQRTRDLIDRLRTEPDRVPRSEVVDLVGDLTAASFDYHFIRPLKDLGVGFTTRKGIDVGLKGAVRIIRSSMQKVIKAMDDASYAKLADYLEAAYFSDAK
ncbi:hypothetical protein [Salinisphaera aquimarina]|uniref:Uncharacterized protein n=1 Tax=Salinisphaera aquimarina TaxID=2094031 RepID=A0ABV7EPD5_9GAMM